MKAQLSLSNMSSSFTLSWGWIKWPSEVISHHHFCDLVKIRGRHHYRLSFVEGRKYDDISKNERLHQLGFAFCFIVILTLWEILFKVSSATSAVKILHRSFLANLLSVCLCVKDIEASVYRLQKAHVISDTSVNKKMPAYEVLKQRCLKCW